MMESHDWNRTKELLVVASTSAFRAFFEVHPLNTVRAVGYTWEWGQAEAAFYCVANTQQGLEQGMANCNLYRSSKLSEAETREEVRWNAGYFPYPAGLSGSDQELGAAWATEAGKLHALTVAMQPGNASIEAMYEAYEKNYSKFLENLVLACCQALAEIARLGLFDGAYDLDYWVGSTDEHGDIVRGRDARVRKMIGEESTMFAPYKDRDASLLIRTDFSDDAGWQSLCDLIQRPNPDEGFQAFFACVDDPRMAAMGVEGMARQAAAELHCAAIFIADSEAINGDDHAILCVECDDNRGGAFRVIPLEAWGPENNLRLHNMDFAEFENAAGLDGVFRGFPA